jgi:hypothetical protein
LVCLSSLRRLRLTRRPAERRRRRAFSQLEPGIRLPGRRSEAAESDGVASVWWAAACMGEPWALAVGDKR